MNIIIWRISIVVYKIKSYKMVLAKATVIKAIIMLSLFVSVINYLLNFKYVHFKIVQFVINLDVYYV